MPQYSLSTIQKIAKDETKIFYLGISETDTRNLGYYRAEIAKCIRDLKESNFYKTYHYTDRNIMDAYKTTYEHPSKKGFNPFFSRFQTRFGNAIIGALLQVLES